MKSEQLREMSSEQLQLTLDETTDRLFRLRIQAQTERLDAPSELRKQRRLIARIKTIQTERASDSDDSAELVSEKPESQQPVTEEAATEETANES
jgi:large subunit ribosomal protein L29